MKNYHKAIIFISLVLIILILFTINKLANRKDDLNNISPSVNISLNGDRVWKSADWINIEYENTVNSAVIYNPVLLTSYMDRLYLGDWGDMSIKVLSLDGLIMYTIGAQGRGPGEFQRIMDVKFNDGFIFITDPEKHEVIIYSSDGDYSHSFKLEYPSYRSAISDDFVYSLAIQDSLFGIYSHEGTPVGTFGKILEDPIMNQLSLSGRIHYIDSDDLMLYIPRMASYLYYYTQSGDLYQVTETLDNIPFTLSNREESSSQIRIMAPEQEVQIMDYYQMDDQLYLLGRFMKGGNPLDNEYFIDVYSIHGDQYFYSVKIPVPANQFTIIDYKYFFIFLLHLPYL